jgi:hypothetical protein
MDGNLKSRAAARRKIMTVAVRTLGEPDDDSDILAMSPSERVALVELLRQQTYAFEHPTSVPRLPRHAWPVVKASR